MSELVPSPTAPLQRRHKLSVGIPVYNELRWVETVLDRVAKADTSGCELEMVVVDDASKDGTTDLLKQLAIRMPQLRLVLQNPNQGKGAALRRGFKEASGDIVLIQDADLEYSPDDYPVLLAPILDGRADAVFGSRFFGRPAQGPLLLALGGEQGAHDPEQHVHQPQPHRHGDLLQGLPH